MIFMIGQGWGMDGLQFSSAQAISSGGSKVVPLSHDPQAYAVVDSCGRHHDHHEVVKKNETKKASRHSFNSRVC